MISQHFFLGFKRISRLQGSRIKEFLYSAAWEST